MKATDNCIGENSTHFIDLFNYRISILLILIRVRSASYKYILIGEGEWYQGHDYNAFQDLRKISGGSFETRNLHNPYKN